jgi:hypothetical protein
MLLKLKFKKRMRNLLLEMKAVFSKKKTQARVTRNSALTHFWVRLKQALLRVLNCNPT